MSLQIEKQQQAYVAVAVPLLQGKASDSLTCAPFWVSMSLTFIIILIHQKGEYDPNNQMQQQQMGVSILNNYSNLFAKQTRKGCFQTLLGCDAQTEFRVSTIDAVNHDVFYVLEESGLLLDLL